MGDGALGVTGWSAFGFFARLPLLLDRLLKGHFLSLLYLTQ